MVMQMEMSAFLFLKKFGGHKFFVWDYWYPELLVMSPLGFKARVGGLVPTWWRCTCIHSLRSTSGVTPTDLMAARASSHWWGLKRSTDWTTSARLPDFFKLWCKRRRRASKFWRLRFSVIYRNYGNHACPHGNVVYNVVYDFTVFILRYRLLRVKRVRVRLVWKSRPIRTWI